MEILYDFLPTPSGMGYHYTNSEALMNILIEDKLRATHIGFMNDANEYWYFLNLAIEHVKKLNRKYPQKLYTAILNFEDSCVRKQISNRSIPPFYVISFTEASDSVSFLDRYGSFSLGINFLNKDDSTSQAETEISRDPFYLRSKVIYNTKEQTEIIDKILQDVDSLTHVELDKKYTTSKQINTDIMSDEEYRASKFMNTLASISCFFKRDSYQDEREIRLVAYDFGTANKKFYARKNAIIPYVELDVSKYFGQWDQILIGNTEYLGDQKEVIECWLKQLRPELKIAIKYSNSGLRK